MKDVTVLSAKHDKFQREFFIESKIPFVIYIVSQTLGRYLETENDIEYSIGLMALNEAIDKYEPEKGSFETFAGTLIKNRVIDEMRRTHYHDSIEDDMLIQNEDDFDLKLEINEFNQVLNRYHLTFDDLVEASPKHVDSRLRAIRVARQTASVPKWVTYISEKLKLPVSQMAAKLRETRRFIYAHHQYILASSLVYIHQLSQLMAWIESVLGGDENDEI